MAASTIILTTTVLLVQQWQVHILAAVSAHVAEMQGGGREINECYSKTKENWSWGMLPGDQRRVTSPQRLK
jgi:hypothetical protein